MGVLKDLELKHGGVCYHNTKYNTKARGGDKFNLNNYENFYLEHLPKNPKLILEIGVLTGTSLRVWSDYWPNATIIGLDIHPEDVKDPGRAELHYFDQYTSTEEDIKNILKNRIVDVLIDDGVHTPEAQIRTYNLFKKYVKTYIIEDINKNHKLNISNIIQVGRIGVIK